MKLKCKINNKEYDKIVSEATFSEEFNETLDSGTIILSHIPRIDNLKPFDDVFVWDDKEEFNGYINKGDLVPLKNRIEKNIARNGIDSAQSKSGASELDGMINITSDEENFYLSGTFVDIWAYFFFNFSDENENECRYKPKLSVEFLYFDTTDLSQDNAFLGDFFLAGYDKKRHGKIGEELFFYYNPYEEIEHLPTVFKIPAVYINGKIQIPKNFFIYDRPAQLTEVSLSTISEESNYIEYYKMQSLYNVVLEDVSLLFEGGNEQLFEDKNMILELTINGKERKYKVYLFSMEEPQKYSALFLDINYDNRSDVPPTAIPSSIFSMPFIREGNTLVGTFKNFDYGDQEGNSFFESTTSLNVDDLQVYEASFTKKEKTKLPSFYKHMLVDNYIEEQLSFDDVPLFKYTINLFSETKALEKIVLPNISITQSLNKDKKRSCLFYLKQFVSLYSPKIKKISSYGKKEWKYINKYSIEIGNQENSIESIFGDTVCPEMSLTNPTLKDLLSRIMIVKDCIPIVKDDVIYAMRIGEIKDIYSNYGEKYGGEFIFNPKKMSFPTYSMSSGDYSTAARREYSNAISQENSAKYIEYLGFRNSNSSTLTLENLQIETRFPIYKINKLYVCFYRKATVNGEDKFFLCKHDISDLVLQNTVRNALKTDWRDITGDKIDSREKMKEYKILTLGYDIGGKTVTGWGEKVSYFKVAWWDETKTYIENILDIIEEKIEGTENIVTSLKIKMGILGMNAIWDGTFEFNDENIDISSWGNSIITPNGPGESVGIGEKIRSLFFQIDYNAMYNGAILHSKDNVDCDDYTTSDNCSSALSILEIDGLFEKEKMNRIGNKIFNLQGRFDSYEDLQNHNAVLGSFYDRDIIIYHREYSIRDSHIAVNFAGTYDYVMKNYFTTVFAKLRTYNLMSYEESVTRSENIKWFFELNTDELYFENKKEELLNYRNFEEEILCSAFNYSQIPVILGYEEKPNLINGGIFRVDYYSLSDEEIQTGDFSSDFNSFVSGYSLCFNIRMYDNVTNGVYVNVFDTIATNSDNGEVKGSVQQWYLAVEDIEDAFSKQIGCYIGHYDSKEYFLELPSDYIFSTAKNKLEEILNLPLKPFNLEATFNIGDWFGFCKDNKEILDVTFQIELINNSYDTYCSNYLLKLCDYICLDNRYPKDIQINDFFGLEATIPDFSIILATAVSISRTTYTPIAFFKVKEELEENEFVNIEMLYINGVNAGQTWGPYHEKNDLYFFSGAYFEDGVFVRDVRKAYISNIKTIKKLSNGDMSIKYTITIYGQPDGQALSSARVLKIEEKIGTLKKIFSPTEENENYYYSISFNELTVDKTISDEPFYGTTHTSLLIYDNTITRENIDLLETKLYYKSGLFSSNNFVTKEQNMYVIVSDLEIRKELVYNKMDPQHMFDGFYVLELENVDFNDIFSQQVDTKGITYININLKLLKEFGIEKRHKSIQYWFKDNEGLLNFVFGVNMGEESPDNIKVYPSLVRNRSKKVYDEWHNPIAHIVNYLDENDSEGLVYGEGQKYKENE